MGTEKLTRLVKIITSAVASFLLLLVSVIVFEYIKINNLNKKIDNVSENISQLEKSKQSLETSMENRSSGDSFIEQYAREELGMLDDNEVYFEFN